MKAQLASQSGNRNIVVQAQGDNIQIQIGLPHLKLIPVGARLRTKPKRDIDLLNPAFQAVPLVGREQDLGFLHHWLNSGVRIGVTAMIGPGGSGKTRLALEILRQLPENWQGGFLTPEESDRFVKRENLSEWSWQKPTLIVVDYAAQLAGTLRRWFAELADHEAPQHPLRILLLERHADPDWGWYRDLADGTWHGQAVREILSIADPKRITPINEFAHRREVLQAGMEAAKALVRPDKQVPRLPAPSEDAWFDQRLAANQWADPLLLLMAAVIAARDGLNAALKLSRLDLAKKLATRELDLIRNGAESPATKGLLAHLYACVTLCGGLERSKAIEVAEREFGALRRQYPGGPGQAAEDLAVLLGAKGRLAPLVPDLIGEAFVVMTFAEYGTQVTTRLAPIAPAEVASSLVCSVQDFGTTGERWPIECLQTLVAEGKNVPPLVLLGIEAAIPNETVVLRELALEVTQFLVKRLAPTSPEIEVVLAALWNDLSIRQSKLGRSAEALASISEAVRRCATLAEIDREEFLPFLARSLNDQACMQSAMGQHTEALASITEAVCIRRELADAKPRSFRRALAESLNNQGCLLGAMGRLAEALASISEAVEIHHALAADDPSELSRHYLAGSLNNQSTMQHKMGKSAEALASITQCIRIRRAIAETNPDAYVPDLAGSLLTLSNAQIASGQNAEALASTCEALAIHRGLAQSNSDAFLHALAESLDANAGAHHHLKQHAEALASIVETVRIKRTLTEKTPAAFLPSLALSLSHQAKAQTEMGQPEDALASIAEAVRHYRALIEAHPDAFLPNLATSLNDLAVTQSRIGQREEALVSLAEAIGFRRALAEGRPDAFVPDLLMSLNNMATLQNEMGRHTEALPSIEEAVRIGRARAGAGQDVFLSNLATSLSILGSCLAGMGKLREGREAVAESLRVLAQSLSRCLGVSDGVLRTTLGNYLFLCQRLESGPDIELLDSLFPYVRMSRRIPMTNIGLLAQQAIAVLAPLLPLAAANAATQMAQGFFKQPGAKLFDWLASKLKGTPAAVTFDRAVAEPENQRRLEALRLEIEDLADKDAEFREELAGILKEIAPATVAVTSTQTVNQTGDNNKGALAGGNDISIQIG
jgi:tetratricopeptide (TPR) repeat protein